MEDMMNRQQNECGEGHVYVCGECVKWDGEWPIEYTVTEINEDGFVVSRDDHTITFQDDDFSQTAECVDSDGYPDTPPDTLAIERGVCIPTPCDGVRVGDVMQDYGDHVIWVK
jgi:hypothetical protein